jgi:outer membrane immunogenic protein
MHLNAYRSSGGVTYPGAPQFFVQQAYANTDWMITARARAGFVADNNWLFYATGGLAVAKTDTDRLFNDSVGALEAGRFDGWRAGYVVGGGIEAPITKQLSLKVEYLYAHFGTTDVPVTANNLAVAFPGRVFAHSTDLSVNIARVGLNYRFVGGDP